ncbi:uncharacterized protein PHACADRAFT_206175 [Phanerochaete carnosa HHB-10118-sp]|uniref:F-box domain-containing protein n=1 Tax=Phanerochaete carnosa (strain HHB-10118-sp) TaxID=650164 RepID=K5VAS1_PHACS|nr:uncharacterized protein PHACADRAFT_206175 [Phanerochaete carnosa HHB-10118-sp]EKM59961.1 hypothetical protein PHACADRAFT_206175 [Phanerochaete carnosa HHB-10118-sp]
MHRPAHSPRLPPEPIHHILKDLDKPSLSACALVSRDWLELTRPYLFRRVASVYYFPGNLEGRSLPSLESMVLPLPLWRDTSIDQVPGQSTSDGIGIYRDTYTSIVRAIATSSSSLQTVVLELFLYGTPFYVHRTGSFLRDFRYLEELEEACVRKGIRDLEIHAGPGHVFSERDRQRFMGVLPKLLAREVLRLLY